MAMPFCTTCDQMLYGENTGFSPYRCKCGVWQYEYTTGDYYVISEEEYKARRGN